MALETGKSTSRSASRLTLVVLVALSLVLVFCYSREDDNGILHSMQTAVQTVVSPASFVGSVAAEGTAALSEGLTDLTATPDTVTALKQEVASLRAQLAENEEYRNEVESYAELLHLKESYDIEGVAAHIIGRSTEAWNQTITIDVGTDDGILPGQTVSGGNGVIGQIVKTTAATSTVRLITDAQSGVAAMVQSTRKEGIVSGSLEGLLYLGSIDSEAVVQVGDVVVTSGMGGSYVRGLIIGQVVKVTATSGDASRTIVVSPNDDPTTVENVIVIQSMGSSGAAS